MLYGQPAGWRQRRRWDGRAVPKTFESAPSEASGRGETLDQREAQRGASKVLGFWLLCPASRASRRYVALVALGVYSRPA